MSDRRVRVPGLHNARDLGGLRMKGGGRTPSGVFLRSESPDLVTEAGWERLRVLGVRTVVDLRRPDERTRDTTDRPAWLTVAVADLHDADFAERHGAEGLDGAAVHYLERLTESPAAVVAALRAIADAPPGAVLIHCVGGRDRTGLLAAVLLAVAGVEHDAIVEDYLETVGNAPRLAAAQGVPNWEPGVERALAGMGTSTEASIRAFVAGLDVAPLLEAMPPAQAAAIRSWRGALAPRG